MSSPPFFRVCFFCRSKMRLTIPDLYRSQVFTNPINITKILLWRLFLLTLLKNRYLVNKEARTIQNTFIGSMQEPVLGRAFCRERKACRVLESDRLNSIARCSYLLTLNRLCVSSSYSWKWASSLGSCEGFRRRCLHNIKPTVQ